MCSSQGWIEEDLYRRIKRLLELCELPMNVPSGMTPQIFRSIMMRDKKNKKGKIRLILLKVPMLRSTLQSATVFCLGVAG